MHIEVEDHRGRLRTLEDHFEADADLHLGTPVPEVGANAITRAVRSAHDEDGAQRRHERAAATHDTLIDPEPDPDASPGGAPIWRMWMAGADRPHQSAAPIRCTNPLHQSAAPIR
jgi:hypothetical protein